MPLTSCLVILCAALIPFSSGNVVGRLSRNDASDGAMSSSNAATLGNGGSGSVVSSSSSISSGLGGSSAGSTIGSGGNAPVVGSMQTSVGDSTGIITSNSGPVVLAPGTGASNGLSIGNGGVGFVSGPSMCALRQSVCEQCLRINILQKQISSNQGTATILTDIPCPFCAPCEDK